VGQPVGELTVALGSVGWVVPVGVGTVLCVVPPVVVVSVALPVLVDCSVVVDCPVVVSGAGVVVAVGSRAGAVVDTGAWLPVPVVTVPVVSGRMFR
jgi:hypothetical protein